MNSQLITATKPTVPVREEHGRGSVDVFNQNLGFQGSYLKNSFKKSIHAESEQSHVIGGAFPPVIRQALSQPDGYPARTIWDEADGFLAVIPTYSEAVMPQGSSHCIPRWRGYRDICGATDDQFIVNHKQEEAV